MVNSSTQKTRRMVGLSILTALVIVLQFIAEYIRISGVPITLTLVPIVVGCALYGMRGGAWLGGVFGVVVWIMSIAGIDLTGALLWNLNPFYTTLICVGKGVAAGVAAAALYGAVERRSRIGAVLSAAVVSPVVNTGLFILGVFVFFRSTLEGWAADDGAPSVVYFIIFGLCGINFVVELALNLVLSSGIERIIRYRKGSAEQ